MHTRMFMVAPCARIPHVSHIPRVSHAPMHAPMVARACRAALIAPIKISYFLFDNRKIENKRKMH